MSPPLLLLQPHLLQQLPRFPEKLWPAYQQPLLQQQPNPPHSSPQTGTAGQTWQTPEFHIPLEGVIMIN